MLNLGRTGTWSLSSLQPPLAAGTPTLQHAPPDCWSPPPLTPGEGKVFAATVWILSSTEVANLPASARLESPGKVLRASRKWLFGCPRHCSTFLDADPAAQEPFQRTGLGQLFLEPAATDLARQQQPRAQPPAPGACPHPSPRPRGRGGGDALAPARPGSTFPAPLDGIFGASLANPPAPCCSPGARGCTPLSWPHSSQRGHNLCPPRRGSRPPSGPRALGVRASPDGEGWRRSPGSQRQQNSAPPEGKTASRLPLSVSPTPHFFFLATSH